MAKTETKPHHPDGAPPAEHPGVVAAPAPDAEAAARRLRAQLHERIAVRAYFLAQARRFAPGQELADWLTAEQQEEAAERPL
ncbi:DUF2934 domain-containing protein [uncultured Thiohalocapsa sp.]|uniref:DUF2934 domain-containing protein n=1 Tax=uncultured Thiohalocapsa sp. TaxID=768990 RepID=UPI0025EF9AD1|nr:DUF2934 domain-containing protein [uncultured Thiohalocapsa sp.]